MGTVTLTQGGFFYDIKLEPERQVRVIHNRCPRSRNRCRATTRAHTAPPHHPCADQVPLLGNKNFKQQV
jgi:hypothetical protein